MSFWKKAGELALKGATLAYDEAKKTSGNLEKYKSEMPNKSDNQLINILSNERSTSPLKASTALSELKKRGYSDDEIKNMLN